MEQNIIEKRNSLISSLFQGDSSSSLAPEQILNATLFVWQKKYKARGVRVRISLPDIGMEDRKISLLALSISFGIERKKLLEAFEISQSTFAKDIKQMSIALLASRKYQQAYAGLCVDIQYYARWHYQLNHSEKENS